MDRGGGGDSLPTNIVYRLFLCRKSTTTSLKIGLFLCFNPPPPLKGQICLPVQKKKIYKKSLLDLHLSIKSSLIPLLTNPSHRTWVKINKVTFVFFFGTIRFYSSFFFFRKAMILTFLFFSFFICSLSQE